MPTTRPRYVITASDEVDAALRAAAERWPQDKGNPRLLLLHLVEEGYAVLKGEDLEAARRRAVDATAGAFDDVYGAGYLDGLREDWPE